MNLGRLLFTESASKLVSLLFNCLCCLYCKEHLHIKFFNSISFLYMNILLKDF